MMSAKKSTKRVHFIGIGGIGMSALARYFLAQKWAVSGSDLASSGITKELAKEGVKVKIGHKKGNLSVGFDLVIYSQAIRSSNLELFEARRRGVRIASYPEVVGELTRTYTTIAVAGAHGKSTTTALVSLILIKGGLDPTVIVGAKIKEFAPPAGGKNFRTGRGEFFVLEADEFGKSFLHYSPALVTVTNIDNEHLDTYKNVTNIKNNFLKFLSRTRIGGTLVLNKDSKPLFSLKKKIRRIAKVRKLDVVWYSLHSPIARKIQKVIKIPGKHNISNALAAYHLGVALKIPERRILKAIGCYHGAWRRMEYRGLLHIAYRISQVARKPKSKNNMPYAICHMPVYDDYAHHPTEIKATLQACREKFPGTKIICVFQPHQAERLRLLFREFQTAFDDAHITLVLPVYKVAGREGVKGQGSRVKSSEQLVKTIQKNQPRKFIFYLADPKKLKPALTTLLNTPSLKASAKGGSASGGNSSKLKAVLVMMGAGDIVDYTKYLL